VKKAVDGEESISHSILQRYYLDPYKNHYIRMIYLSSATYAVFFHGA
jgi:hypothetical protein